MTGNAEGFRLSIQQRRVWSLWRGDPSARAWSALRLEGPLDSAALRRATEKLVASHEILRTTFHREPGMRVPFQVVVAEPALAWEIVHLDPSGAAAKSPGAAADELARQEAGSPLSLESGPVFHLRLARVSDSTHVLLLALPALCADRRTLHNIVRQLADLYGGRDRDDGAEPPIQYADYSQWQDDLLRSDGDAARAGRAYWEAKSTAGGVGRVPFATIGTDPRGAPVSEFVVDVAVAAKIDAFCQEGGFTAGDFLLACWQTLLWRTTGHPDVLVRSVEDGRRLEELEDALGLFASALPIETRFDERSLFSDAVQSVAGARRQNDEWQEYFARKDDPKPDSPTGPPGFEFFERPELPRGNGVAFSVLRDSARVDAFPAWVVGAREEGGIRISCATDPACMPAGSAGRIAAHLEPLISAAASHPSARSQALPILNAAERGRLLVDLNQTVGKFPRSRTIHELFEEQVERSPDSAALVFGGSRWTYRELNARANSLAWLLRERGGGPGVRVGLALERSAETIVALLAILKAGGAYVPVVPDHPAPRLSRQLVQSECRLLITESKWLEKFADFSRETICLDQERDRSAGGEASDPPPAASPEDVAYVMHTSGSTGVPKGVPIRHESLVNYAHFIARELLGIDPLAGPKLAFGTVSTISADLGNTAIFPSLISGGCLHVVPFETAMEGGLFAEYMARNPIDVLKIVPSHFEALLSSGGTRVLPRRFLILGGEALPAKLVERIRSLGGSCEIVNHYGPTETTVGSLTFRVPRDTESASRETVPIGRPIANTEVFILDDANQPVPVGVPGELFIGGIGVARGYADQPEETAARFVPHPFGNGDTNSRLYRTGDRARYLPDGNVEFLGRVDDQVKIRGFRIEPGEVRAVLAALSGVRECVVVTREDSPGERRLVAYVVPTRASPASAEELRRSVRGQLPDYMIPAAFVMMKGLPLTSNGKVDRDALPAPEHEEAERPYVAPRTPSEQMIAATWKEVLRLDRIGVEDNFFDLGGHSLLLTLVVSRLRKSFGRELPIRWLFESPTVASLAGRIDAAQGADLSRILDELESLPEEIENEPPFRA